MDQNERIRLKELYARMPDQQLVDMAAQPQNDYQEGAYLLLAEEIKRRELGAMLAQAQQIREQQAADAAAPVYEFVRVYSTPKPGEIAIIKSLLDSQEIPYSIQGEHFGSLYGPADGLSSVDVMIRQDYCQEAEELLKDFINPPAR